MLQDSASIQEADAQFVSRKRAKHGQPPVQPPTQAIPVTPAPAATQVVPVVAAMEDTALVVLVQDFLLLVPMV